MDEPQQCIDDELIERIKRIPIGYPKLKIETYFWLGVVSAILLRATYLLSFNLIYSKLAWYLGVIGYMLFFMHRYKVSIRRKQTIKHLDLLKKIEEKQPLGAVDYHALHYVLWSLSISKEKLNYLIILAFSFLALGIAFVIDFLIH